MCVHEPTLKDANTNMEKYIRSNWGLRTRAYTERGKHKHDGTVGSPLVCAYTTHR